METIHVHSANFSSSDAFPFNKFQETLQKQRGVGFATEPWRGTKVEELKMLSLLTQTTAAGPLTLRTHVLTLHTRLSLQLQDLGLPPFADSTHKETEAREVR